MQDVLFDNMVSWIWEHSNDYEDFVRALRDCGFSQNLVEEMAKEECWDEQVDIAELFK